MFGNEDGRDVQKRESGLKCSLRIGLNISQSTNHGGVTRFQGQAAAGGVKCLSLLRCQSGKRVHCTAEAPVIGVRAAGVYNQGRTELMVGELIWCTLWEKNGSLVLGNRMLATLEALRTGSLRTGSQNPLLPLILRTFDKASLSQPAGHTLWVP